jgi:hypothetical protein
MRNRPQGGGVERRLCDPTLFVPGPFRMSGVGRRYGPTAEPRHRRLNQEGE